MKAEEPARYESWQSEALFADMQDVLAKFNAVLESSYDGIYITDGDANTIMVNKSYEAVSGLRREDVLGRNMRDLVKEGVMDFSGTILAMENRGTVTIEQKFKTGKRAVITSTPTIDQHGEIVMVVTNVRDITEIHNLRKQLVRKEELSKKQLSEIEIIRKQIIGSGSMVAVDGTMLRTMLMVNRVAHMDTVVLLLGETGVGKEMVASYIHQNSARKEENLIKVNCGAIPEHLMESELFGYERGSFTGAEKEGKMGLFEVANKGTIFLDEVGDLPMDAQVKLLRVVQEKEIQRIGATRPRGIDVRILAATNRDLEAMVRENKFRKDLYYRLNVFPITVPPLRERPGDILPLAESILAQLNKRYGFKKELSQTAELELQSYSWPGNVRELRNVVERAMILSAENSIQPRDLAIYKSRPPEPGAVELPDHPLNLKGILEALESSYIEQAYQKHRNIRRAAKSLSMDAATYVRKRKKYAERDSVKSKASFRNETNA